MGETVEAAGQDPEQVARSYAGACSYSSNLAINLAAEWVWPGGKGDCRQSCGAPVTV